MVAYEVKVSRSDFARELEKPEKRKHAEQLATETWFAVPKGMVEPREVPEGWGLVEVSAGGQIRLPLHAKQREIEPWPWEFVRAIARRSTDSHSQLPGWTWKARGREMTEEELIKLGEETARKELWREKTKIQRDALHTAQMEHLFKLHGAVKQLCGLEAAKGADEFRRWFWENVGASHRVKKYMRDLYKALGETLAEIEQNKEGEGQDG